MAIQYDPNQLHGIVDMGSNGIRFSVSTLQPPTARVMPTLYQHRAAISLYDAQYSSTGERQPISNQVIADVIAALRHFKRTCNDFGVPERNITILATEATRTAVNSEQYRQAIKDALGWTVTMLPKEEEGRVGAMGIASSLPTVSGLVMDLGGGSTQLSWLIKQDDRSEISMPESGAVSMPFGAAAMSRCLAEAQRTNSVKTLREEIIASVKAAYAALKVPASLEDSAKSQGGFSLHLSGGGFRGWGYVLMSQHKIQPYPIPLINGFRASRQDFLGTDRVQHAAASSLEDDDDGIFRVSERRATQVPAVALLVSALAEALPQISEIRFCQGGVREGFLYKSLSPDVRSESPLVVASKPYSRPDSTPAIVNLLQSSMPAEKSPRSQSDPLSATFSTVMLSAFANLMYVHSSHSKDVQAAAALRCTTTGVLADTHGVLHESRAVLALLLCSRWGASVSPTDQSFKQNLELLLDDSSALWWINYLGAVASLVGACHPAGIVGGRSRLNLQAAWGTDSKGRPELLLRVAPGPDVDVQDLLDYTKELERVGKPKRWIGGKNGAGYKISVLVVQS